MKIGQVIKDIRESKRIKQGALAESCKISQTYLSLIEAGKKIPNLETLRTICDNLNVPLPFLMLYSMEESDVSNDKLDVFKEMNLPSKQLLKKVLNI